MADKKQSCEVTFETEKVTVQPKEGTKIKLNVDVSDALTGLKAVQREAKLATRAVAELEAAETRKQEIAGLGKVRSQDAIIPLKAFKTADLVEELSRREGVSADYKINYGAYGVAETSNGDRTVAGGPARILVVRD